MLHGRQSSDYGWKISLEFFVQEVSHAEPVQILRVTRALPQRMRAVGNYSPSHVITAVQVQTKNQVPGRASRGSAHRER